MQPALTPLEQQQINVAEAPAPTFWHRVRFDVVRRHVERTDARAVLDIGAGSGLLGDHLRQAGIDYTFTEASAPVRAALVARFGRAAESSDDASIGADTVVTLLDVIEHVEDDLALLTDLRGRMEPGAGLVITVPAMRWLFSSWDRDLGHHRRYHRSDARRLIEAAGFELVEVSYLFPELVPVALLRRFRTSDGTAAEFPTLPNWLDRVGAAISSASTAVRRFWPVGTSVLVIARRLESPT